jgi:hypothetical protein
VKSTTKWIAAGVATVALLGVGGGVAVAAGQSDDDGSDHAITGDALTKASAAALESTGSGRVTETEVGDEESMYEVEVTLDDGSQVDVQLDENFRVVSSSADSDEGSDEGDD